MIDATENLVRVARALQRLRLVDAVFVGGATVTRLQEIVQAA